MLRRTTDTFSMTCSTTPSHLIAPRGNLCDQPILSLESANIVFALKGILRIHRPCARIISDLRHQDLKIQLRLKLGLHCVMSLG